MFGVGLLNLVLPNNFFPRFSYFLFSILLLISSIPFFYFFRFILLVCAYHLKLKTSFIFILSYGLTGLFVVINFSLVTTLTESLPQVDMWWYSACPSIIITLKFLFPFQPPNYLKHVCFLDFQVNKSGHWGEGSLLATNSFPCMHVRAQFVSW